MNSHDYESYQEVYNERFSSEGEKFYDVDVGKLYMVDVTHIYTPHSFYVRPIGYKEKMRQLALFAELIDAPELSFRQSIVYYSKKLNACLRAEVLYIENDESQICHLYAIDHGCIEAVPIYQIWLPPKYKNEPPLAKMCCLEKCMPINETWEAGVHEKMKRLLGKHDLIIRVKEKTVDRLIVELHNEFSTDISTVLKANGFAIPGDEIVNKIFEYNFEPIRANTIMPVIFLVKGWKSKFFVVPLDDVTWHLQMKQDFTGFARQQVPLRLEDVTVNRPVGIFFPNYHYERGIIICITAAKKRAQVQLVDSGLILDANVNLLKPIPNIYLVPPVKAIKCMIDPGIGSPLQLQQMRPGTPYNMKIVRPGTKFGASTVQIAEIGD